MAHVANYSSPLWTAVDLVRHFGAIPLERVVNDPPAGAATVEDVVRMDEQHSRLCELIDGTLVEKTIGAFESYVALQIATLLNEFLRAKSPVIALGADGMIRLFPDQVRIPDACFISSQRLEGSGFPDTPMLQLAPDLAVEVVSRGNTDEEMGRKLREYFEAGVRLVWYVYPDRRMVRVYTAADTSRELSAPAILEGEHVLPGLEIPIAKLFEIPGGKK